jgi:hypothetical protein
MQKSALVFLVVLTAVCVCKAALIVVFDPTSSPVTNKVTRILPSEDTLKWIGRSDVLINPVMPPSTNGLWKVTNSTVTVFSQDDLDTVALTNAIIATNANIARLALLKSILVSQVNAQDDQQGRIIRALAELVLDSHNMQAESMSNIMFAISGASSLVNLQTRVNTVPTPPQFTLQQLKNSMTNKLSDD